MPERRIKECRITAEASFCRTVRAYTKCSSQFSSVVIDRQWIGTVMAAQNPGPPPAAVVRTDLQQLRDSFDSMKGMMGNMEGVREADRKSLLDKIEGLEGKMNKLDAEVAKKDDAKEFAENVKKFADATSNLVQVAEGLKSGDPAQVVLGLVSTFASFAALTGPQGAVLGGILMIGCTFFRIVMVASSPRQPSLAEQMQNIVRKEIKTALELYKLDDLTSDADACSSLAENMKGELDCRMQNPHRDHKEYKFLDYQKFITLLAKLAKEISKDVKNEEEGARSVSCMIIYTNVCSIYLVLLTLQLSLAHEHKPLEAVDIKRDIDIATTKAENVLSFLSDEKVLSAAGMIDDHKRFKMIAYLNLVVSSGVDGVKCFLRNILHLEPVQCSPRQARGPKYPVEWPIIVESPKVPEIRKRGGWLMPPGEVPEEIEIEWKIFTVVNHTKYRVFLQLLVKENDTAANEMIESGDCFTKEVDMPGGNLARWLSGRNYKGVLCLNNESTKFTDKRKFTLTAILKGQYIQFAMDFDAAFFQKDTHRIKAEITATEGNPIGIDAFNSLQASDEVSSTEHVQSFRYEGNIILLKTDVVSDGAGTVYHISLTQTTLEALYRGRPDSKQ